MIAWIEAALVIFVIVFVAVTIRVALRRRGYFDDAAHSPLSEDATDADASGPQGDPT